MTKISALLAAASHCFISGGSVGQDDHSVIGRRVAIYGDAIESVFHGVIHGLIEAVLPHVGIRRNVAKHGCHVRIDHTSSFGTATNANPFSVDLK